MKQVKRRENVRELSNSSLIESLVNGDEEAFRILYRRYVHQVRSTLRRLIDRGDLDDLTQEVFLRIWRARAQLRGDHTVVAWIYRIAVNVAMDQLRSKQRIKLRVLPPPDPPRRGDVEKAYEISQLINAALALLGPRHRTTLVLHDLEGLTEAEVSQALGIPQGTVKSRLFQARRRVRDYLEQRGVKP